MFDPPIWSPATIELNPTYANDKTWAQLARVQDALVRIYAGFRILYWFYGADPECLSVAGKHWSKIAIKWLRFYDITTSQYDVLSNAASGVLACFLQFCNVTTLVKDVQNLATDARLLISSRVFSATPTQGMIESKADKGFFRVDIRYDQRGLLKEDAFVEDGNWYLLSPAACTRCAKDLSTRNFKPRPCLVSSHRATACGSCDRLRQMTYCDRQWVMWVRAYLMFFLFILLLSPSPHNQFVLI